MAGGGAHAGTGGYGKSLSVAEADRMLKGLAEAGHLEVRVRGGGLFYTLWEEAREIEGQ